MPFINELLADNQQQNLRETPRTRTSRFDFEPEAIAQRLQQRILGQPQRVVDAAFAAAGVAGPGEFGGGSARVGGGGGVGAPGGGRAILGVLLGIGARTLRAGGINPRVAARHCAPFVIGALCLHVVGCVRGVDVARRVPRRGGVGVGHVRNLRL